MEWKESRIIIIIESFRTIQIHMSMFFFHGCMRLFHVTFSLFEGTVTIFVCCDHHHFFIFPTHHNITFQQQHGKAIEVPTPRWSRTASNSHSCFRLMCGSVASCSHHLLLCRWSTQELQKLPWQQQWQRWFSLRRRRVWLNLWRSLRRLRN